MKTYSNFGSKANQSICMCTYCNAGELEETMAELEESRRKLVIQQLQRHGGLLMNGSGSNGVNGLSTDKSSDKSMGWGDLKDAVDEAKVLSIIPNSIILHMYALSAQPLSYSC
jgi:hypothetical protein